MPSPASLPRPPWPGRHSSPTIPSLPIKGIGKIYAPFADAQGQGAAYDGATGVELNYGAAAGLQLTLGLPLAYAHDHDGWTHGVGDLKLSAKYRFYHDEEAGISVAAFPGLTLPTASNGLGSGKVTAADVAQKVFDAISANQFYIYSHPKAIGSVQTRLEDILQARNPTNPFAHKPEIGEELKKALRAA